MEPIPLASVTCTLSASTNRISTYFPVILIFGLTFFLIGSLCSFPRSVGPSQFPLPSPLHARPHSSHHDCPSCAAIVSCTTAKRRSCKVDPDAEYWRDLGQSSSFVGVHFINPSASHSTDYWTPRRYYTRSWAERPVLLLLGIRLGIECVNPIYYETIKVFLSFTDTS